MLRIYIAADLIEARLLLDCLTEAGIEAELKNEIVSSVMEFTSYGYERPEVWIPNDEDWERARQVVHEYEARKNVADDRPELVCGSCGESSPPNFELCWSCGAELSRRPYR